ncbi:hypothetical protein KUCAC02_037113, partial [Chaenocephalus aceratus]
DVAHLDLEVSKATGQLSKGDSCPGPLATRRVERLDSCRCHNVYPTPPAATPLHRQLPHSTGSYPTPPAATPLHRQLPSHRQLPHSTGSYPTPPADCVARTEIVLVSSRAMAPLLISLIQLSHHRLLTSL